MGKAGKLKKRTSLNKQRISPYAKPGTQMMSIELDDDTLNSTQQGAASEVAVPTERTRGAIVQRHKLEWKAARKELEAMKTERQKLRKKNLNEKAERKALTREMKDSLDAMKKRQERELDLFDLAKKDDVIASSTEDAAILDTVVEDGNMESMDEDGEEV